MTQYEIQANLIYHRSPFHPYRHIRNGLKDLKDQSSCCVRRLSPLIISDFCYLMRQHNLLRSRFKDAQDNFWQCSPIDHTAGTWVCICGNQNHCCYICYCHNFWLVHWWCKSLSQCGMSMAYLCQMSLACAKCSLQWQPTVLLVVPDIRDSSRDRLTNHEVSQTIEDFYELIWVQQCLYILVPIHLEYKL